MCARVGSVMVDRGSCGGCVRDNVVSRLTSYPYVHAIVSGGRRGCRRCDPSDPEDDPQYGGHDMQMYYYTGGNRLYCKWGVSWADM